MNDDTIEQKQIEALTNKLLNANKIIFTENLENEKLTAELVDADKELTLQNKENKKLTAELVDANKKIVMQSRLIKVQMEKQLLEKTLMCIGDAIIATDLKNKVKLLNKAAESITGWTQKEALGKSIYIIYNILNEVTHNKVKTIIAEVITSGQIHQEDNPNVLITKDGKEILIEDTTALIINEKNISLGVVIVFRDHTKKWERLNKIESQSFRDELTGLYNRRFYIEELERMDTKRNLPLSLIMGDVNGLKLINDSFGHGAGDELLRIAADAISEGCRTDDIAARLGGDEFIIMLPKTDAADAALVIERIQSYYKTKKVNGLGISISFGTGTKMDESQDINDVFIIAEKNMYKHKVHESASIKSRTIDLITKTLF
jgi:diguanylate cyclase